MVRDDMMEENPANCENCHHRNSLKTSPSLEEMDYCNAVDGEEEAAVVVVESYKSRNGGYAYGLQSTRNKI
ncbi:hypothetical protein CEXT_392921 [Caerostris extrusa]|uniref:Uncharacterized protein n=1 Tax=Caerostris extrusa TaxID=172846 RepID=A0AAV4XG61_CAEEX|nr:hypothetical protein CEXT_392921 [Caerostris extrusa]